MPVNLPERRPTDPLLLALLMRISENGGNLLIDEDEFDTLEGETHFRDAQARKLIHLDHGGEWSTGAVISITRRGRSLIGGKEPESFWRKLEMLLWRRQGGSDI